MFGPILQLDVPQQNNAEALKIELAPLEKERMGDFIANGGMQSYTVTRFLGRHTNPVLEDEMEWFEKTRTAKDSIVWGVWVCQDNSRALIGTTALNSIEHGPSGLKQATSGVLIFDKTFWRKGIAGRIHMARTWFAFCELGITRIVSAVIQGNEGSLKALEKSGYTRTYVERNICFTDGALRHLDNLECLNPLDPFWSQWWGEDTPSPASLLARETSLAALVWARASVTLP